MWLTFLVTCILVLALIYLPGLLLLLSANSLTWGDRLAGAPLVCIGFYSSVAIIYPLLGIRASLVSLAAPLVLIALGAMAVRFFITRHGGQNATLSLRLPTRGELITVVIYALFGIVLTTMIFVKNLDGAASFFQGYDNGNHLNTIRVFLETGNFSSFNSTAYAAEGTVAPFSSPPVFYPSAWHLLVALVVSVTESPITLGVNAVNAMLLGVVFPLSMRAFLGRFFDQNNRLVYIGSVACLSFSTTVWDFVNFGPLYPMLMSYALVPVTISCFIALFDIKSYVRKRVSYALLFSVGCIAIALAQPSGIFLMAVVLAPFFVWQAYSIGIHVFHGSRVRAKSIICSLFVACFVIIIWMSCNMSPFFQNTVSFNWPAYTSWRQAVIDVVLLSMCDHGAQLLLACFVCVGLILACMDRKRRWLVFSYAIAIITFIVCSATEGNLKHILGGFWYTDTHRLAANVAIIAAPFAVLGADFIYRFIRLVFDWAAKHLNGCPSGGVVAGLSMVLSYAIIFYPSFTLRGFGEIRTSFGGLEESIKQQNDVQAVHVLDDDEIGFVNEALSLVPNDSLIINYANDGSGFLYGLYGLNIYYRDFALPPGGEGETPESRIIRNSLNEIASNDLVREAVEKIDARYVLLLDQGDSDRARDYFWSNYPSQYPGLVSITDETPGFTVVLSRGDMRLYQIDY